MLQGSIEVGMYGRLLCPAIHSPSLTLPPSTFSSFLFTTSGKTTFLRALASGDIKGLPRGCQVLHVEQEVVGDDTPVLQAVLECDTERAALLEEEASLMAQLHLVRWWWRRWLRGREAAAVEIDAVCS
jgi:ATPase subunit of ABC transporter with duplicated ATPase domains